MLQHTLCLLSASLLIAYHLTSESHVTTHSPPLTLYNQPVTMEIPLLPFSACKLAALPYSFSLDTIIVS